MKELHEIQRRLDERIVRERGLEGQELLFKKLDALRVELGELENETKHFKYWSSQEPSREKMLEEYVDCLHFLLSIGNEIGEVMTAESSSVFDIGNQFRELTYSVLLLYSRDPAESCHFRRVCHQFFGLGDLLDFTMDEIKAAYMKKNRVNHLRQSICY